MKIISWEHLIDRDPQGTNGLYTETPEYSAVHADVIQAIGNTVWPPDSDRFTIYPESGKKRGMGNGVTPIKLGFTTTLVELGWTLEKRAPRATNEEAKSLRGSRPGAFDCHFEFPNERISPFVVEWETGNIASSHRAVNRIGLGIHKGYVSGGLLIVPSNKLAPYLTDRIGNPRELRPYHDIWKQWTSTEVAYFGIIAVEHDDESFDVPKVPKGTDGRAAR
ncbi:hypothetical protein [Nocardia mangyaensis]|uniref:hypothetical protein n=1 Tax=Nocardia mangyaensis TaxID=2213200 RepID=UPI002674C6F6|nr:hypothetical protein [Nocardia mangyaensis]MDO3645689.1 hypothetical protein [Nocardia mangyaensis]